MFGSKKKAVFFFFIFCLGHTIDEVTTSELNTRIVDASLHPKVCYGTFMVEYASIIKEGLLRRDRNHFQFAPTDDYHKSFAGMRSDVEILVYIDLKKCLSFGVEFFESSNGVIITEGVDGRLQPQFFTHISTVRETRNYNDGLPSKVLWNRDRDYVKKRKFVETEEEEVEVPVVIKRRYKIFGEYNQCPSPPPPAILFPDELADELARQKEIQMQKENEMKQSSLSDSSDEEGVSDKEGEEEEEDSSESSSSSSHSSLSSDEQKIKAPPPPPPKIFHEAPVVESGRRLVFGELKSRPPPPPSSSPLSKKKRSFEELENLEENTNQIKKQKLETM